MNTLRTLIAANSEKHEHFGYYEAVIEVIEQNIIVQPDICIESCKSLIEGISKTILKALDPTVTDDDIKNMDVMPLFKKAARKLAEFDNEVEPDFINRSGTLVENFGMLRNQRGDISHGKAAPKVYISSPQFSALVARITEALAYYILDHFFRIDLSYSDEVSYEDNPDFNQSLDDLNPFEDLSYSKALFDQDNVSYCEQLLEFQTEREEETPVLDIEEIEDYE